MAYSLSTKDSQDLKGAIEVLEAASKTPARTRTTKVGPIVDEICGHAYRFGLIEVDLQSLVVLVTSNSELDQGSITTVIKNLYPSNKVSDDVVVYVVNFLGQAKRKPPVSVQVALVRWITAIYDVLEHPVILSRLYGVLFNLLDMISLRPALCQLLSFVTRRKHVRPFRIQRLFELAQQTANEPALMSLLRVYKNFCPDIVIATIRTKIPTSLLPDREWRERLQSIQQSAASIAGESANVGGFRINRSDKRGVTKSVVPEVHTFNASEGKRTLEEVQSASELVQYLEVIELPSQLASALRDPLFQKYLQLGSSTEAQRRLDFWLKRYFEDELENVREGYGHSAILSELLMGVASYTEVAKTLHQVVEQFLQEYLPFWNGDSDLDSILGLLRFLPPKPFPELQRDILSPLQSGILIGAKQPFETLFRFYANLAERWMTLNSLAPTTGTSRDFLKSDALFDLTEHVSLLAQSAIAADQPAEAAILGFYENMADLITDQIMQRKQILPPILPPRSLTYALASSPSLSQLSRLCALLVLYKRCFEKQDAEVIRVYQADATNMLNGYLIDICNMIWRSRALNTTDTNAAGLLCPDSITTSLQSYLSRVERDYSVHTMFDFSHSLDTASISLGAFSSLEEEAQRMADHDIPMHAGPVSQRSLIVLEKEGGMPLSWKQYRLEILDWLEKHGISGTKQLMFATMKDLMK